jgi:capsular polysaccharide biosynthesis protein
MYVITPGAPAPGVITYISRQGSRRRLREADHAALVAALEELAGRRGWELNVVRAEALTTAQQLALAARSTVLLGVHGNGLTHLLMLAPTPRTTVIEIFYPGGFAHDYEWTARALGLRHYAVRNDTSATWPELPWVAYPEGFQGTDIPVHAPTVAALIEGRMDGTL